jgi:hypothetical protein
MVPDTMYEEDDEAGYLGCPECGEDGELVSVWRCAMCGRHVCDACCAPSYLCLDCDEENGVSDDLVEGDEELGQW